MTTVKSFINQFVAIVQGDNAQAQAIKTQRLAAAGLRTQIAALEGSLISKEESLKEAEENVDLASVNRGKPLDSGDDSRTQYVTNLLIAQNELTEAKDALALHKKKIAFLKDRLEFVDSGSATDVAKASN
jgi:hypothetical protein